MDIVFVFAKCFFALCVGWVVYEIIALAIIRLGEMDQDVDMWPAVFIHHHPTFTDDKILQPGFSVIDRNQRHEFYRVKQDEPNIPPAETVRQPIAVQLYRNSWVGVLWRHLAGFDAVEEEGENVL